MKVSTEKLPESQVALQIEVDDDRLQKAIDSAYRRMASKAKIPGFRPGKAPRAIVERHFGEETIRQEAIDRLMPEVYQEALVQERYRARRQGALRAGAGAAPRRQVHRARPPHRRPGRLPDLRVFKEPVLVDPERVQEGLESLRRRYSTLEPITRPLQWNDVVRADVEAA